MEQSEVLWINPKHKSKLNENNDIHKNRNSSSKINNLIKENETQLPNSIERVQGSLEIQVMQNMSGLPGISNNQNVLPIMQPQYPNQPQQMIPYQTPLMMNNIQGQNIPIVNQISPVQSVPLEFGFGPAKIRCPYCLVDGSTKTEESFSCCACFACCLNIIIIPLLICAALAGGGGGDCDCNCNCNCCNGKCCTDVNHYCSNCGKLIGKRDSLKEICPFFKSCCP